jgi:hypothetical protein
VAPEAAQAGLAAMNHLLPRLLAPGRTIGDLSALADRHPAAVASWLQGEREYRRFNFAGALELQRRAVARDSLLAVAALRGAQAASWLNDLQEAGALTKVALRHVSLLPDRMADFARGLDAYVTGQADSAVHWLTRTIRRNPEWTEAHMALGEVYYHLLPSVASSPDSLAQAEFILAATDTGFTPPRFHLAEIAVRQGSPAAAEQAVREFNEQVSDNSPRAQLSAMLACAHGGRQAVDWHKVVASTPGEALRAAQMLAVGGKFTECAEDGLRVVFDDRALPIGHRWGAFLGLQGVLAAEGRTTELRRLVDTAVASGLGHATQLYLLDVLAGVAVEPEASAFVRRLQEKGPDKASPSTLWLVGAWQARKGERAGTEAMRTALTRRSQVMKDPWIARFADVLSARLSLLDGDTTGAIGQLRAVLGAGRREALDWDLGESLAADRLLLAELLLARGHTAEAMGVAGVFDHPAPAVFLPFLPASLALRHRAALALGRDTEAGGYQQRLVALGQGGASAPSPSTHGEVP